MKRTSMEKTAIFEYNTNTNQILFITDQIRYLGQNSFVNDPTLKRPWHSKEISVFSLKSLVHNNNSDFLCRMQA